MPKVFLSMGHGGTDPGAVGFNMKEKDINLEIGLACKAELERHRVTVVASRIKDEDDSVAQEVIEANNSMADISFSIHTNAGGGDGSESFYYSQSEDGKRLAELCEKYTKQIGQNSRGIKEGDKLYFIRKTNMTAVLSECAFIDNDTDNNIIDTSAECKKFGIAYAKAILEYFGIPYHNDTQTINKESIYYKKYTGTATGINEVFRAIGVPSKYIGLYKDRKPVAVKNGINNYTGTYIQNTKLIELAKQGKLKKA